MVFIKHLNFNKKQSGDVLIDYLNNKLEMMQMKCDAYEIKEQKIVEDFKMKEKKLTDDLNHQKQQKDELQREIDELKDKMNEFKKKAEMVDELMKEVEELKKLRNSVGDEKKKE
ncbi:hypothetical protein HA402_008202 [Bradysia odoriphaga]|nr:hypothetical protein HA402_008202 [Bradysia odoriphaga]